jgi:lysophospholipase L1-like esterase
MLRDKDAVVYSMAIGGWAATQYLYMAEMAMKFRPRTLVVACYSGNDALESFASDYTSSHWSSLKPDITLDSSDTPAIGNLLDVEASWPVKFRDAGKITFTPVPRLAANNDHSAVHAGYAIMAESARRIAALSAKTNAAVVFTVIPTRELVYAKKVSKEGLSPPESYRQLVDMERKNIDRLARIIQSIPDARFVDLVTPLQSAALGTKPLYPRMWDGHPGAAGYQVIAAALTPAVREALYKQTP